MSSTETIHPAPDYVLAAPPEGPVDPPIYLQARRRALAVIQVLTDRLQLEDGPGVSEPVRAELARAALEHWPFIRGIEDFAAKCPAAELDEIHELWQMLLMVNACAIVAALAPRMHEIAPGLPVAEPDMYDWAATHAFENFVEGYLEVHAHG